MIFCSHLSRIKCVTSLFSIPEEDVKAFKNHIADIPSLEMYEQQVSTIQKGTNWKTKYF